MNEEDLQALEPRAGDELDRTIARYMRVRLDPTAAETRRVRAAVMEEAWRRRLTTPVAAAADGATRGRIRRRGPFASWGGRRVGFALAFALIAGLTVGSSAFAASRAGGPLYDTRVALEELTLPTDPTARLEAELALAQGRVADMVDAASRGDEGAVEAAARAYGSSLADFDSTHGSQADRALAAVRLHQAVLRDVLTHVPTQAQGGIAQALARSTVAIDHLDNASGGEPSAQPGDAGQPANPPNAGNGNGNGNGNAGGNGNGNAGGNGNGNAGGNGNGNAAAMATPAPRRLRTVTATPVGTATGMRAPPRHRTAMDRRTGTGTGMATRRRRPSRRRRRSRSGRTSRTRASRRRRRRRPPTDGRLAPCAEPRQRAVRAATLHR